MSVSYYHEITAFGDPSAIKDFKATYQERLCGSIINYYTSFAVENEFCDIVSLDKDNRTTSMQIVGDSTLYFKYGVISPDRYDAEFVNEIIPKCDTPTKYSIALHTRNRSLRDEIYLLSLCFPLLVLQRRSWSDTDADGQTCTYLKAGEELAWLRVRHTSTFEEDIEDLPAADECTISPTASKRDIAITIFGANNDLIE